MAAALSPELRAVIDQAIADGKVVRLPSVRVEDLPRAGGEKPIRFNPEHCGKGDKVKRSPHLDEIDSWYFS